MHAAVSYAVTSCRLLRKDLVILLGFCVDGWMECSTPITVTVVVVVVVMLLLLLLLPFSSTVLASM
ncbi:hypothetical protein E2C01_015463 [Portunus trituberculatus]|uniref:Uncharacterized protein n=1 Tax=Portunus trituberculatus TaxID=210409 RepID=A0A5B7DLX8_PORTR|nr:hypothetical protein [Portunus trituberculatus]